MRSAPCAISLSSLLAFVDDVVTSSAARSAVEYVHTILNEGT